jgi:hypothetical protein
VNLLLHNARLGNLIAHFEARRSEWLRLENDGHATGEGAGAIAPAGLVGLFFQMNPSTMK